MAKWKYVEDGYQAQISKKGMKIDIILHVGHGIPGHWDRVQGYAVLTLRPQKQGLPDITERMVFDTDGTIDGEFFSDDGITAAVGESWDIGTVVFIAPETLDDGDERNDDIMKIYIEKYVKTLVYADELDAARDEGFCT